MKSGVRAHDMVVGTGDEAVRGKTLLHDCFFSHETGNVKPSAAAYEHVLAAWQVAPARILFLDDREENVNAARDMGMRAIQTLGRRPSLPLVAQFCFSSQNPPRRQTLMAVPDG